MATIRVAHDREHDVTLYTVAGELTPEEVIATIERDYATNPTTHILWDLTDGSLVGMTSAAFRRIADVARERRRPTPEGRTAYVGSDDLAYGLMRMYTTLAYFARVEADYEVFRTREEALAWLTSSR
ncbi:MAG TPA: STAS/SEC14 domain-containing protein [Gemmatimonadales bacterium]|nr:STAS/SEC14 domain-containing protein [Gemmatimonadales bacterium]